MQNPTPRIYPVPHTNDAQPTSPPAEEFIHGFSDLAWDMDNEPPYPNNPNHPQLYHLLTITGLLIVGAYPHDTHTLNEPTSHYIAWAPLLSTDPSATAYQH